MTESAAEKIHVDALAFEEIEQEAAGYAGLLYDLREAIACEARAQGVTKSELARRLNVSRSRITRVMDPGNDIRASSLHDLGAALNCAWRFRLSPWPAGETAHRNNRKRMVRWEDLSESSGFDKSKQPLWRDAS